MLNFQKSNWQQTHEQIIALSKKALTLEELENSENIRLVCFYFDPENFEKCMDIPVALELMTPHSLYFTKSYFFKNELQGKRLLKRDNQKMMFITKN